MAAAFSNRPPLWHTALLSGLFVAVAIGGALLPHGHPPPPHGVLARYLPVIAIEWGLLLYVHWADREIVRSLLHKYGLIRDLLIGAAGCALFQTLDLLIPHPQSALLPRSAAEKLAWVLVSFSAGLCEEVVFRGYLQARYRAVFGSRLLAVVLQAALFGAAHGNQGVAAGLEAALFGALLGVLADLSRSIRPGVFAHVFTDLISGFLPG